MRARACRFLGLALWTACCAAQAPAPSKEARRAFEKAEADLKARRIPQATREFEQAVALDPSYAEAWNELGRLRMEARQTAPAREAFEAAIRADPKQPRAYLMLAALEQGERRWPQVIELTEEALRLDAIDYAQAWLLNAIARSNLGDFSAAEKSAREAERIDGARRFADSWRLLGLLLERRGDYAGAAEQFREYLKLAPAGPEAAAIRPRLEEDARRAGDAAPDPPPAFRSDTSLALVRFQLHPNKGQPARDLTAGDIEIREDGVPQKIAVFEGGAEKARTVPVEISLLFDCSASVEHINALGPRIFHQGLLDEFPNASIAIYGFSDELERLSRPTRDDAALRRAMQLVAAIPQRDTPLFGAIASTVEDAAATGGNVVRLMAILSDGESTTPGDAHRAEEAARMARQAGASLFPVLLSGMSDGGAEAAESVRDFVNLASETGGAVFSGLMGSDLLPRVLKSLADEVRSEYVAGFYVSSSAAPKRHRIEVALRAKDRGRLTGGARELVH